jgi:hypothetical protein
MVFRAGEPSANPSGRPKALREIQDLARSKSTIAINALSEIAEHGQSESARVAASAALLDRAWGKPGQTMDISVLLERKFSEMSAEELMKLRASVAALEGDETPLIEHQGDGADCA